MEIKRRKAGEVTLVKEEEVFFKIKEMIGREMIF